MSKHDDEELVVPLVDETLKVEKRSVETGRVRISTVVETRQEWVEQSLEREEVSVERVPVNRVVDAADPPAVRQEGDVLVIPILEEVIEKRLVLKEELRIRKRTIVEHVEEPVTLRSEHAVIERDGGPGESSTQSPVRERNVHE